MIRERICVELKICKIDEKEHCNNSEKGNIKSVSCSSEKKKKISNPFVKMVRFFKSIIKFHRLNNIPKETNCRTQNDLFEL